MSIYGKKPVEYLKFARTGMILIVLMGLARFFVGISGVPFERATHLVSLTNLTLVLLIIYGHLVAAKAFGTYRHLLGVVAALTSTMYAFIILAILTESFGGFQGYFHYHSLHALGGRLPPQMMGMVNINALMNVPTHIFGQIVGWILATFLGWGFASVGFLLSRYLGFLRNAFLVMAGVGVFRLLVGAVGVPQSIGTWISSITLAAIILGVYYGQSAPSHGFNRYWQVLLIAVCLSAGLNLVIIVGMLVASNFGITNYFNPEGMSVDLHIVWHIVGISVDAIVLAIFAAIAFAFARRSSALLVRNDAV